MRTKPPCTNYKFVWGTICEFHNDCCNSRGTKEEKDNLVRVRKDKTLESLEQEYNSEIGSSW